MDISLWPASSRTWANVAELARLCERELWHGIWFADHLMPDSGSDDVADGDCIDAWVFLSALAATTSRLRLGSLVAPVSIRHPSTLASAAASLALVSGDRFVLGVGAGWQANEHAAYGFDLGNLRERSDRLEEACGILRALLDDARPQQRGNYYEVRGPTRRPTPGRKVPLLVGGKGEHRTLRTVALHADEWNGWCDEELFVQKHQALTRHCEAIGRDPAEVRCSINAFVALHDDPTELNRLRHGTAGRLVLEGTPDQAAERLRSFAALGVDEVIVADWNLDDRSEREETLERFAREVFPVMPAARVSRNGQ
ncbi:MAG: LLM class flavin-dependent oxidoreductase [Acidimicrobiales bacterium]|nr:LLM class flavin-dependent oxidoreductase [Acidimicrobiales bacterium]